MDTSRFSVIVPVYNGGLVWRGCVAAIRAAVPESRQVFVVDSGSSDGSAEVALDAGFILKRISTQEFDHGGTRQMVAASLVGSEILVFLTQDAIMVSPSALENIVAAFDNPKVGLAYGRQLPRQGAAPIEAHARLYNYPAKSEERTLADISRLGIKTAFTSNSFAAYRASALFAVGGFPNKLILAEDMVVAARMIEAGWAVSYVADACVRHSHNYTLFEEFKRYFDIGVLHTHQSWLINTLGKPEGEGARFVRSELSYLWIHARSQIPYALMRTGAKYIAYKLGNQYRWLPMSMRRRFSMHKRYWDTALS